MRATVAGLPAPLRLALGLFSAGAFGFLGLMFVEQKPLLGYIFIALAVFRLYTLVRQTIAYARWAKESREGWGEQADEEWGAGDEPGSD